MQYAQTLPSYLRTKGLTQVAFARMLGVTALTVHRWCKGERRPANVHMERIIRVTNGEVRADSFFPSAQAA